MRITKLDCRWDMEYFGPELCRKYKLEYYDPVRDKNGPVVFFGCYSIPAKQWIMNNRNLVVIVWSGSDSTRLHEYPEFVDYCKANKDRIFHIAHSHWIQTDLLHWGFSFIDRVILPVDLTDFVYSSKRGRLVYHYGVPKGGREFYYGTKLMKQLQKMWGRQVGYPEVFITAANAYDRLQLLKIYEDSFVGVRLTEHDNMALSCIELGLMGRYSIFNGNIPCAIPYMENPYTTYDMRTRTQWVYQDDSLLPKIAEMILERRDSEPSKELAEEMREFVYDDEKWLDTSFYG